MEAWGFLNNKVDHVAFAKQYAENGRPGGDEETTREVGVVGAVNFVRQPLFGRLVLSFERVVYLWIRQPLGWFLVGRCWLEPTP